jgi:MFS family permease
MFALIVLSASTLFSMSVWFSATFIVSQLNSEWRLSSGQTSMLTIAVQLGFVLGAVASAASGLADRVPNRILICCGAIGASAANLALLLASGIELALPLRLLTGFFLAAVYPPAMKEVSTWFLGGRGKALGVMIGALTLGSALPHAVSIFGQMQWEEVIAITSVLTAMGGLLILLVKGKGAYPFVKRPFRFATAFNSLRNRDVVLANLGYMGHMWELYAMWACVGAFIASLPSISSEALSAGLAFVCIGVGAFGCLVGGAMGDRLGRAKSALICLVFSGGTVLFLGLFYSMLATPVVIVLCAFWGFWVIADSAQFSALVTERADPIYVGGALSLQLALGYLTTMATLWLVPTLVNHASWNVALISLAIGPVVGIVAMRLAILRDGKDPSITPSIVARVGACPEQRTGQMP